MKTPTVGQVEVEMGPTGGAFGQDRIPVATVKQTTQLVLVRAMEKLTQRLEQLEEAMQRRDTAMQSQRYGEQAARGLRESQPQLTKDQEK